MTFYPTKSRFEPSALTPLFRIDIPEQAEALHGFRAAFAGQTDIEALDENHFVLHVRPGVCACGEDRGDA